MIYYEVRLNRILIEGLPFSAGFIMRIYWGARNEATMPTLAPQATNFVKVQEGSHGPNSSVVQDIRSRSGRLLITKKVTPVIAIKVGRYSFSSPSEGQKKKEGSRFRGQSENKKMQTLVTASLPQKQALVNHSEENAGFPASSLQKDTNLRSTMLLL